VPERSNGPVLKTGPACAQVPENTATYGESPKALGALLGALAAEIGPSCPDLAAVVNAWPGLPAALKAGIVAIVEAASGQ
jgi:hypothetical protein